MVAKKATISVKSKTTDKPVLAAKKALTPKTGTKAGVVKSMTAKDTPKKRITILAPEGIVMATKSPSSSTTEKKGKTSKDPKAKKVLSVKKKSNVAQKHADRKGNDSAGVKNKTSMKETDSDTNPHYSVLQLRHLPEEFQEPQLIRFFSQFDARVVNTYCVRNKKNHKSKGIAYVQFDREEVIPLIVEECHGMLLGGFTVRARKIRMNRPMPNKLKIIARRKKAFDISTKGMELKQFDLGAKQGAAAKEDIRKVVGYLIKYSKGEKKNNERNTKVLGIDYTFDGFQSQLKKVDRSHFVKPAKKTKVVDNDESSEEDGGEVEGEEG